MEKLITIKNKETAKVSRVPISLFKAMNKIGVDQDRFKHWISVPKKLWKRKVRDENRIRSKKKPRPFASKLNERLALKYGRKSI